MSNTNMPAKAKHHGKSVKRLREILYVKQDVLADALGISQQSVSLLETKEVIDRKMLEDIAKVLKVPIEAIENFEPDETVQIITNTFNNNDTGTQHALGSSGNGNNGVSDCTFNSLDEMLKAMKKNEELYERLLQAEKEKVAMMEKMMNK